MRLCVQRAHEKKEDVVTDADMSIIVNKLFDPPDDAARASPPLPPSPLQACSTCTLCIARSQRQRMQGHASSFCS